MEIRETIEVLYKINSILIEIKENTGRTMSIEDLISVLEAVKGVKVN